MQPARWLNDQGIVAHQARPEAGLILRSRSVDILLERDLEWSRGESGSRGMVRVEATATPSMSWMSVAENQKKI